MKITIEIEHTPQEWGCISFFDSIWYWETLQVTPQELCTLIDKCYHIRVHKHTDNEV